MLQGDRTAVRADGSDKFFGMENVSQLGFFGLPMQALTMSSMETHGTRPAIPVLLPY